MGDRSHISDSCNGNASGLQGTNSCLSSTARTFNIHLDSAQTIIHCSVCCVSGSYLGGIGGAFPGTLEPCSTGTPPGDNIAFRVSNSNNSIIKGRLDISFTFANLFVGFLLFWHLSKTSSLLLSYTTLLTSTGHCLLWPSFGSGICARSLSMNR